MDWIILGIPVGIVLLYFGSDWMVDGAKKLALKWGVTPFVVGLTIVAFGSSAPETITSFVSADNPQIILGNIVGSNIANVGLAIGLAAMISPIVCKFDSMKFEMASMMVSVFVITGLSLFGVLKWFEGVALILALFLFVYLVYRFKKDAPESEIDPSVKEVMETSDKTPMWLCVTLVILGLVLLYFGARFFIDGAVEMVTEFGINEQLVGLFVVAVGTSLPELCICLLAAKRHENELVVSNIVGSIVFNCFFALGVGLLVTDVPITHYMMVFHLPVMIIMAALLFIMTKMGNGVTRKQGAFLFGVYFVYVALMAVFPELTQGVV